MVYECEITQELLDVMIDVTMQTAPAKKQLKRYKIRCFTGALLMLMLALVFESNIQKTIALAGAAILFLFTFFGTGKLFKISMKKMQKKQDPALLSGFRRYTFSEDDVTVESPMGKSEFRWEAFSHYIEYEHYIFIALKDNRQLIVDKSRVSKDELEGFMELLGGKIKCVPLQK